MRYIKLLFVFAIIFPSVLSAESVYEGDFSDKSFISDDNCFQRISDTIGGLWLAHSNRMAFGRPFQVASPYPDDDEQTENLPFGFNANFPARSSGEYLYAAGLWVGGVKGGDTLVSHAFDYVAPVPELNPDKCPGGAFQNDSGWADIEHIAIAYDTLIVGDTLFRCQVGDCNDWYPLGIKVTSHSYTWESPPFDRCVIVEYRVQNVDTLPLEDGWVGIYSDCDIGYWPGANNDDISGYMDGAIDSNGSWVDLNLAYSLDMNGDPAEFGFDEHSTRGAFGVQVLGLSEPGYEVNFNWWVVDRMSNFDWAPRRDEPVIRDLGGSFATAYGDSNKYYVMSHPEVDYNQIEAGLKHPGWQLPDETAESVTLGNDTRFVISAGPFDLLPLEEVTFTVAFVAGDNLISNPYIDMWFDPADRMSVSDYYELLDLDELEASGLAAASVFREGYDFPPPGPPRDFRLVEYDDTYASFIWSGKYASDMAGYHLMRKAGDGEWEIAAVISAGDTSVTLEGLDPDILYKFAVASVDDGGAVGKMSHDINLLPSLPHPSPFITGASNQTYPVLEWAPSPDPGIVSYRVYRIENDFPDTVMLADIQDTTYIDLTVAIAQHYVYFVTAVNAEGIESMPSPNVELVPMSLTSGILALNANPGNITSNLTYDLDFADSLFARGLDGLGYTTRRVDSDNPVTIHDLAGYSLVVISSENRSGALSENLEDVIPIYLANGGKVILILRHAAVEEYPTVNPKIVNYSSQSFFSRMLKIDSSYIGPLIIEPGYRLIGDLVGASSQDAQLPDLRWDSARVNQFGYVLPDGIPYCGYFWPDESADVIYRYEASDPGNPTSGQASGIRYKGDDYQFYLLNFPLSLMETDSAAVLLRSAVIDLGEHFICGDVNGDLRFNIGDIVAYIQWLYNDGAKPVNMDIAGDVDCSGVPDLADALVLINFYCNKGLAPGCCR